MTGFEALFGFYGLLLGLAITTVTSSFADTWRRRGNWKIGIAPPLLGLFILLATAQQWSSMWRARDVLTLGPWEILTCMGMALPYIFVSHAMFPADLANGGSLEDHYMQQRPVVLGALLMPPLVSPAANLPFIPPEAALGDVVAFALGNYGPPVAVTVALLLWKNRLAHGIGMALLCTWMLVGLFA